MSQYSWCVCGVHLTAPSATVTMVGSAFPRWTVTCISKNKRLRIYVVQHFPFILQRFTLWRALRGVLFVVMLHPPNSHIRVWPVGLLFYKRSFLFKYLYQKHWFLYVHNKERKIWRKLIWVTFGYSDETFV